MKILHFLAPSNNRNRYEYEYLLAIVGPSREALISDTYRRHFVQDVVLVLLIHSRIVITIIDKSSAYTTSATTTC